jgi:hypothetical protein
LIQWKQGSGGTVPALGLFVKYNKVVKPDEWITVNYNWDTEQLNTFLNKPCFSNVLQSINFLTKKISATILTQLHWQGFGQGSVDHSSDNNIEPDNTTGNLEDQNNHSQRGFFRCKKPCLSS